MATAGVTIASPAMVEDAISAVTVEGAIAAVPAAGTPAEAVAMQYVAAAAQHAAVA
jgi:hypothetical protein